MLFVLSECFYGFFGFHVLLVLYGFFELCRLFNVDIFFELYTVFYLPHVFLYGFFEILQIGKAVPVLQPVPIQVSPIPHHLEKQEEIDQIKPPVSTSDFQKLLEQLIVRQSRLEQISMLTRRPDLFRLQYQTAQYPRGHYQQVAAPVPLLVSRQEHRIGPVQFVQQGDEKRYVEVVPDGQSTRNEVYIRSNQNKQYLNHNKQYFKLNEQNINRDEQYPRDQMIYATTQESLTPTRRVVRLLKPKAYEETTQEDNNNYLPSNVREMLLLRMLQLAINPALPLDENEMEAVVNSANRVKKTPIRNVEILGEEHDVKKHAMK